MLVGHIESTRTAFPANAHVKLGCRTLEPYDFSGVINILSSAFSLVTLTGGTWIAPTIRKIRITLIAPSQDPDPAHGGV